MQRYPKVTKEHVLFTFVLLFVLPILFYFLNFERIFNLDYLNYKQNYDLNWKQFEYAYSLIESAFQYYKVDFEMFWFFLLSIEILMVVILYNNRYLFVLAIPNLLYLSQGLLGTQVRFGVAVLFSLVIFKCFFRKNIYYLLAPIGILFHNGVLVFVFLAFYLKILLRHQHSVFLRRNFYWVLISALLFVSISFLVGYILSSLGYGYYVGTKYQEGRSMSAMLYLICSLSFLLVSVSTRRLKSRYSEFVYLGLLMIIFSLAFNQSSVISGRYSLVYMLIEPFVIYSFFITYCTNNSRFYLSVFLIFLMFSCSKLFSLNLIF
ncbi:EpsG family protein [Shewanella abyssi]|uniref:EpsG family protein n=1 Tax=Shewanella abyssi TaxID=311789 RepID=UPI003D161322